MANSLGGGGKWNGSKEFRNTYGAKNSSRPKNRSRSRPSGYSASKKRKKH